MRDPVAESIRNEQNMDAAPHPSEIERPNCEECGKENTHPKMKDAPDCSVLQLPVEIGRAHV